MPGSQLKWVGRDRRRIHRRRQYRLKSANHRAGPWPCSVGRGRDPVQPPRVWRDRHRC